MNMAEIGCGHNTCVVYGRHISFVPGQLHQSIIGFCDGDPVLNTLPLESHHQHHITCD